MSNTVNIEKLKTIQNELSENILELNSRCLYASAKWCAELLNDINNDLVQNHKLKPEVPLFLFEHFESSNIFKRKSFL